MGGSLRKGKPMLSEKEFQQLEINAVKALYSLGLTYKQILDMLVKEYGSSSYFEWWSIINQLEKGTK